MTQNNGNGTTLVLGLGNILMGDEGFGVHVARRLKEIELPDGVRVEEGGVGGFNLLGLLEGVEQLIVVDVMILPSPPGELRLLEPEPGIAEPGKVILSFHQVGVLDLMQMWGLIGKEPEVKFLVTQPKSMELGDGLSPPVQAAADKAVRIVKELCTNLNKRSQGLCIC
jgi:hydrogenase maturation protease